MYTHVLYICIYVHVCAPFVRPSPVVTRKGLVAFSLRGISFNTVRHRSPVDTERESVVSLVSYIRRSDSVTLVDVARRLLNTVYVFRQRVFKPVTSLGTALDRFVPTLHPSVKGIFTLLPHPCYALHIHRQLPLHLPELVVNRIDQRLCVPVYV